MTQKKKIDSQTLALVVGLSSLACGGAPDQQKLASTHDALEEEVASATPDDAVFCKDGTLDVTIGGDTAGLVAFGRNNSSQYSWFSSAEYEQVGNDPWHVFTGQVGDALYPLSDSPRNRLGLLGGTPPVRGNNYSIYAFIYNPCTQQFTTYNRLYVNYWGCPQSTWLFRDGVQLSFSQTCY
jgi:hypothetical protein